jgi:hypothetical protein
MAASDEAITLLDGARTDGLEQLFGWRAEVLAAAGNADAASAARARATAEVEAKADRIRDPELRKHFLASRSRGV